MQVSGTPESPVIPRWVKQFWFWTQRSKESTSNQSFGNHFRILTYKCCKVRKLSSNKIFLIAIYSTDRKTHCTHTFWPSCRLSSLIILDNCNLLDEENALKNPNPKCNEACHLSIAVVDDKVLDVAESWEQWRADFQSGSKVLKKVFWIFSYLYVWHTMWFHAEKMLKTLKFWKLLNSLC